MQQLLLDIQHPPVPLFDQFVVGQNAELLHHLKSAISSGKNQAEANRFIYIWGESGSGKTHLLKACEAGEINAVCVDDVHLLDMNAQIALFNTYNQIRAQNQQKGEPQTALIVVGNAAPTQMHLRDDLATRLAWGLTYQVHALTDEEKALALMTHADARGMRLPTDVIEYCLRYLRRDLPTLIATINDLDEWSLTMKKPVTVPMLRQLLQFPMHS